MLRKRPKSKTQHHWSSFNYVKPSKIPTRKQERQTWDTLKYGLFGQKSYLSYRKITSDPFIWRKTLAFYNTRQFSNHESRLLSQSHTFAITVTLDLKIQSMWMHWPFFPKTWTKGHWPLDDLWPHVCWGHMCDSTQGSLCPSPMTIHQCMWIQWSILQNTTYIHTTYILQTYYVHTTYRMSDHIVSY